MYNSTWGNTHRPIDVQCPAICGHREFNASIASQSRLRNNSWYVQWLMTKGNRLYDLENQLVRPYFNGSLYDYVLMEDHKRHLMNDSSILHFHFGHLRFERTRTFDPPPSLSNAYTFLYKTINVTVRVFYQFSGNPDAKVHFLFGFFVAAMVNAFHKLYVRFVYYRLCNQFIGTSYELDEE